MMRLYTFSGQVVWPLRANVVPQGVCPDRTLPRLRLFVLSLLFALGAASLAGCGRRGPLEAPPGSTPPPPARTGVVDPTPAPDEIRPSLARNTNPDDGASREQVLAPATTVTVPKTPFILDPLL